MFKYYINTDKNIQAKIYKKKINICFFSKKNKFIIQDLVVDMTNFYTQYKSIEPYLKRKDVKNDENIEYY